MSPLSANCAICGAPKPMSEFAAPWCGTCDTAGKEGGKVYAAENPTASESEIMYAERMSRQARAHSVFANRVDPRDFSATRGVIPTPPKGA